MRLMFNRSSLFPPQNRLMQGKSQLHLFSRNSWKGDGTMANCLMQQVIVFNARQRALFAAQGIVVPCASPCIIVSYGRHLQNDGGFGAQGSSVPISRGSPPLSG